MGKNKQTFEGPIQRGQFRRIVCVSIGTDKARIKRGNKDRAEKVNEKIGVWEPDDNTPTRTVGAVTPISGNDDKVGTRRNRRKINGKSGGRPPQLPSFHRR